MSFLRRHRGYLLLSLFWVVALGGILIAVRRPRPAAIQILPPPPTAIPAPTPTPKPLRVYVSGAVVVPDVYELPSGSIVKDAVLAAGGLVEEADSAAVPMALTLSNGMQVHVPRLHDYVPTPIAVSVPLLQTTSGSSAPLVGTVDINNASLEELEDLPGIGPAMAERIVANRPYGAIEDIVRVKGIGEATFAELRDLISVQ